MSRRKKVLLLTSPLAVLLALALVGSVQVDRMQAEADLLAETGKAAINLTKELAGGIAAGDPERIAAAYADDYRNPGAAAWSTRLASDRDGIRVYPWESGETFPSDREEIVGRYLALLEGVDSLEMAKFKLARVESIDSPTSAVIRAVLWMRGDGRLPALGTSLGGTPEPAAAPGASPAEGEASRSFETIAHFRMWIEDEGEGFKIKRQDLVRGETVTGPRSGFGDATSEVGLTFTAAKNPAFAAGEWELKTFAILQYGTAGASAVDYDGDGWYDLFLGDGEGFRLYRNRGDGTFYEANEEAGLPLDHHANVGLFADFDGDGDPDLVTAGYTRPHALYRNEGDGTFTDVSEGANLGGYFTTVASAVDYDLDGDLDLYLGRYLDARTDLPTTLFYTRNGQGNVLLRNDGGMTFTDVTEESGTREGGLTLGTAWADYDHDGDPDLYVANDFGRNAYLSNNGDGTFTDLSDERGALDFGFGMSADAADPDNDGDLDIYISNVHSGQRWYGQSATLVQYLLTSLRQGTIREDFPLYREIYGYAGARWRDYGDGMVKGNSLLLNDGAGGFTEVAEKAGANPFGWYWASTFFDYDNDGLQDVYAANGWITGETHDDL